MYGPYKEKIFHTKEKVDIYVEDNKKSNSNKWILRCEYPLSNGFIKKIYLHLYLKKIKGNASKISKYNPIIVVNRNITKIKDYENITYFLEHRDDNYKFVAETTSEIE